MYDIQKSWLFLVQSVLVVGWEAILQFVVQVSKILKLEFGLTV